jgi:hypothetical protein
MKDSSSDWRSFRGARNDQRFLASSNPLIDFTNKPTTLLSLSSRHCVFLLNDPAHARFRPQFTTCDAEMVAGINRMTRTNA